MCMTGSPYVALVVHKFNAIERNDSISRTLFLRLEFSQGSLAESSKITAVTVARI
jgi:hypothetical protein